MDIVIFTLMFLLFIVIIGEVIRHRSSYKAYEEWKRSLEEEL